MKNSRKNRKVKCKDRKELIIITLRPSHKKTLRPLREIFSILYKYRYFKLFDREKLTPSSVCLKLILLTIHSKII